MCRDRRNSVTALLRRLFVTASCFLRLACPITDGIRAIARALKERSCPIERLKLYGVTDLGGASPGDTTRREQDAAKHTFYALTTFSIACSMTLPVLMCDGLILLPAAIAVAFALEDNAAASRLARLELSRWRHNPADRYFSNGVSDAALCAFGATLAAQGACERTTDRRGLSVLSLDYGCEAVLIGRAAADALARGIRAAGSWLESIDLSGCTRGGDVYSLDMDNQLENAVESWWLRHASEHQHAPTAVGCIAPSSAAAPPEGDAPPISPVALLEAVKGASSFARRGGCPCSLQLRLPPRRAVIEEVD